MTTCLLLIAAWKLWGSIVYNCAQKIDNVKGILLTYGHFDHAHGVNGIYQSNPEILIFWIIQID